jgi:DNA-binding CsgD family transcriptional regulator
MIIEKQTSYKCELTEKENEILTLLLQGKTPDEIGGIIGKSTSQVYRIMKNIMRKIKS